MARPKKIQAAPISKSTEDLLEKIKKAVASAGIVNLDGQPIDNFDPIEQLAILAADPNLDKKLKIEALKDLAGYIHPKVKTVEIAGSQDKPIQFEIRRFSKPNA